MIHTSDIYFQKALVMQRYMSTGVMIVTGFLTALVPVLFSILSITHTEGEGSSCVSDSIFAYSAVTTVNLQIDVGVACFLVCIGLLICSIPLIYLELKYREYKRKYIRLQTVELALDYISWKKWHPLSLNADTFEQIYEYIAAKTFFSSKDILDSLYGYFGKAIDPLLEKYGWWVPDEE